MLSFRLTFSAIFMTVALTAANASALSIDTGGNNTGAAQFSGDPDDKIPFPHVADDGQPSNNFQPQGTGATITFAPAFSNGSNSDAFQRAQDRFQQ